MKSFFISLLIASVLIFPFLGMAGLKTTPDRIFKSYLAPVKSAIYGLLHLEKKASERVRQNVGFRGGDQTGTSATTLTTRSPTTWRQAKRDVYELFKDNPETVYCGCKYSSEHKVDWKSCGYQDITHSPRSYRTEVEHMVPARWIGQGYTCWAKGGRKMCDAVSPGYKTAAYDLHNLAPSVGLVNKVRSAKPYRDIPGEPRAFGACDFEVSEHGAEPSPSAKGVVARATLYMRAVHGVSMGERYLDLMRAWDKNNPPRRSECIRNLKIARVQGYTNEFVDRACEKGMRDN